MNQEHKLLIAKFSKLIRQFPEYIEDINFEKIIQDGQEKLKMKEQEECKEDNNIMEKQEGDPCIINHEEEIKGGGLKKAAVKGKGKSKAVKVEKVDKPKIVKGEKKKPPQNKKPRAKKKIEIKEEKEDKDDLKEKQEEIEKKE